MLRAFLAALLVCGFLPQAQAQSLQRIDIVSAGIVKLGKIKTIDNPSLSTESRTESNATLVRRTTTIPGRKDTVFGAEAEFIGSPKGRKVEVRIVWRYPEPGLRNPATGKTTLVDEYSQARVIGERAWFYWNLAEEWTLVPGEWKFEIWQGDRKLATQNFLLQD